MQRLFSMFPAGAPGAGLLIMRVALSILLLDAVLGPLGMLHSDCVLLVPWAVSAGLWIGLLTPVVATLCVFIVLGTWLGGTGSMHAVHVCAVLDAAALSLLGPGAYSLDARLFGRRKIIFPPRHESDGG